MKHLILFLALITANQASWAMNDKEADVLFSEYFNDNYLEGGQHNDLDDPGVFTCNTSKACDLLQDIISECSLMWCEYENSLRRADVFERPDGTFSIGVTDSNNSNKRNVDISQDEFVYCDVETSQGDIDPEYFFKQCGI